MSTTTAKGHPIYYTQIPTRPDPQPVIVLVPYDRHPRRSLLRRSLIFISTLFLLSLLTYTFYPSRPCIKLARAKLNDIRINSSPPSPSISLSFLLSVKVRNPDLYSLNYDSLNVHLGYRGRELGVVKSSGGFVRARSSSYVDAIVELDGLEIVHDLIYLLEDLSRGFIPFDTVTEVEGTLGVFSLFEVPIKGRVSCEVYVSTRNQTVTRQDCYPE